MFWAYIEKWTRWVPLIQGIRIESKTILDLVLSNIPHSVTNITAITEISRQKAEQRKIYKYNQTDWDKVGKAVVDLRTRYFERDPNDITVENRKKSTDL